MVRVAEQKNTYLSSYEQFEKSLTGEGQRRFRPVRRAAMRRFAEQGFPTTREEQWRFTNLSSMAKIPFQLASNEPPDLSIEPFERLIFGNWECYELVFIDGRFSPTRSSIGSLPEGVRVQGLGTVLDGEPERIEPHLARYASFEDQAFVALNTAFLADGACVTIPRGCVLEKPIQLLFISTVNQRPTVSHPRNLIVAEANSQARIIESYVGLDDGAYFTNAVTEIVAAENAIIDHYKLQRESRRAFHVASLQIHQARSSNVSTHSISLGGGLVRHDINAVLDGEGSECTLNGLYVVAGRQHVDHHTTIDHAKPHCSSRELYKGVLDEQASGVFNGKIIVRPGAQKTDAQQTNKNLLLSEDALVHTNPQLEIYADDVKCAHGATIGQLDADAVFYLRSRGIDREMAKLLLTYAFVNDITARIKIDPVRTGLECNLFTHLPHSHQVMEVI